MECSAVKEAGGLVQNLKEDNLKVTDILQIRHGKENYRLIFVVVVTISAAFWQGIVIYLTSIRAINCKLHNVINCLVYKKIRWVTWIMKYELHITSLKLWWKTLEIKLHVVWFLKNLTWHASCRYLVGPSDEVSMFIILHFSCVCDNKGCSLEANKIAFQ